MKLSVIIPTYIRRELLKNCLISLVRQNYPKDDYEIFVIDDEGNYNVEKLIKQFSKGCNLRYLKTFHKGPAAARNLGIKNANGEIIGFIDDDAETRENWISNALGLFADRQIVAVEGKVEIDRKKITPFSHNMENLKGGLYNTCNMFYRKSVLDEVGGFDEKFHLPFREDADLAFRVMKKGYKIIFSPEVVVFHETNSYLWEPFKQASRYYIDPLLYKKHPKFYYSKIDVYDFNKIKLIHPRRRFYLIYIILCILNLNIYIVFRDYFPMSSLLLIFVYLIILFGHLRLWKNRSINIKDILLAIPIISITPFIYYYYLIKGMIKFKSLMPW